MKTLSYRDARTYLKKKNKLHFGTIFLIIPENRSEGHGNTDLGIQEWDAKDLPQP